jgi:hypothetical protein
MNKVLILRWAGSAYDSLGGLLDLIGHELTALGLSVATFAADAPDWPKRLVPILAQGDIAFALTMSGIGSDVKIDGKLIWESAKVPLFNWNCDHPGYFPLRHAIRNQYLLHGYVFPDHAAYNIRHLHPNGAAYAVHLGIPPRTVFPQAPLALKDRNGRIMFTKTGQDTNATEVLWRGYSPDMRQIMFAAAEELFCRSTGDFLPTLQRIAEPFGLFLGGDSRLALLMIREIDHYIRFKRTNLVMKTILRYPVDVFGTGWDHINSNGAAAKFHGATTWADMIGQLPRYVGCLSTNPLIEDSVHDRVFFALAAGVAPISDDNRFARTHMPTLAPYLFDFTHERIEQAVEAVLARPEDAITRANDVWQNLSTSFGLRRAVHQIIQFVGLHNLNTPCMIE